MKSSKSMKPFGFVVSSLFGFMLQAAWTCLCNLRTGLCDLCVSVCTQRRVAIPQASRTDTAGRFLENEKFPPKKQKSTKNETKRPGMAWKPPGAPGGVEGGAGGAPGGGWGQGSSFLLVSPGVPPRFPSFLPFLCHWSSILPGQSPRFSGGPSSILLVSPLRPPRPQNPARQALDPAELQNPPQSQFWAKLRPKEKKH